MTALVLLAAGLSERFGEQNKMLAKLNGKPMLKHVIEAARGIKYEQYLAIVSNNSDIENICKSNGYEAVLNDTPERGQGRSIALGAKRAMELGENSICILLGDMPFISTTHLEKILESGTVSECVFSTHKGERMPPAMFSGAVLKELTLLHSREGAKSLFSSIDCVEIVLSSYQPKILIHKKCCINGMQGDGYSLLRTAGRFIKTALH